MTDREFQKLSRAELLEMLLDRTNELERLKLELEKAEKKLSERKIALESAGSIAEASLSLNGVFEAAQQAAGQYLENIALMKEKTERECNEMIERTKAECREMVKKAEEESSLFRNAAGSVPDFQLEREWWDELMELLEGHPAGDRL